MMSAFIVSFCAAIVLVICVALIFHCHYEDGLFGRIGLIVMALASFARIAQVVEADFEIEVSRVGLALWAGLALFLGRHFYRFWRWRRQGDHAWRPADQVVMGGKRPR